MKNVLKATFVCLFSVSAYAGGGIIGSADQKPVTEIVCQSLAKYEEETPENKTPATGIKIFKAGSRADVKSEPGAFLLSEYSVNELGVMEAYGNQQFYLSDVKDGKIQFNFIASWKASGELKLNSDGTAVGFINQKSHITDLSCVLK